LTLFHDRAYSFGCKVQASDNQLLLLLVRL